jgi:Ran GTPase-activating protein (RanGAP) involved in mRNA processing and transport
VVSVPSIRKMKLSGCKITPQLSVIVGNILKRNDSLTDLDLSFNMIGTKGAEAIGKALETNEGLVKLNLRSNDLGYTGTLLLQS